MDAKLGELYQQYKRIDRKYLYSIALNIHGNKIVYEDKELRREQEIAFRMFYDHAKNLGMDNREIANYIIFNTLKKPKK